MLHWHNTQYSQVFWKIICIIILFQGPVQFAFCSAVHSDLSDFFTKLYLRLSAHPSQKNKKQINTVWLEAQTDSQCSTSALCFNVAKDHASRDYLSAIYCSGFYHHKFPAFTRFALNKCSGLNWEKSYWKGNTYTLFSGRVRQLIHVMDSFTLQPLMLWYNQTNALTDSETTNIWVDHGSQLPPFLPPDVKVIVLVSNLVMAALGLKNQ